eukprot:scaffold2697_cov392-Prasinococcus_capsulatus_cf.AAC.7
MDDVKHLSYLRLANGRLEEAINRVMDYQQVRKASSAKQVAARTPSASGQGRAAAGNESGQGGVAPPPPPAGRLWLGPRSGSRPNDRPQGDAPEGSKQAETQETEYVYFGDLVMPALSTRKGRGVLTYQEVVQLRFPKPARTSKGWARKYPGSSKAVNQLIRFCNSQGVEAGRLGTDSKCLLRLHEMDCLKVHCTVQYVPEVLEVFTDILLRIEVYVKRTALNGSSLGSAGSQRTEQESEADTSKAARPVTALLEIMGLQPDCRAMFTPEELKGRVLHESLPGETASGQVQDDARNSVVVPASKRLRTSPEADPSAEADDGDDAKNQEEGSADIEVFVDVEACDELKAICAGKQLEGKHLRETELPPNSFASSLRPYQKQALTWMLDREDSGQDSQNDPENTLHPCWESYCLPRQGNQLEPETIVLTDHTPNTSERKLSQRAARGETLYHNVFTGEVQLAFPSSAHTCRGGILADSMGLGKTVMTAALLAVQTVSTRKRRESSGGTLIVCPMSLLEQWHSELQRHCAPGLLRVMVFYGTDRHRDVALTEWDVVVTTYGTLGSELSMRRSVGSEASNEGLFDIKWERIVLDEAHSIKNRSTNSAKAAFALNARCKWCLTGTPLQNELGDLYCLLKFLHVEPWCHYGWWVKLIQRPYEAGDGKALLILQRLLQPLMLRRTKETLDKDGQPILVLPEADIQLVELDATSEERDFYEALFRRSKTKFDKFVAQGRILHNYASILELLLRLRQCCDHPYLVLSRSDGVQYNDLGKLAARFLRGGSDARTAICEEYVQNLVKELEGGEKTYECPICMDQCEDPVFTPCGHVACRQCLFSYWQSDSGRLSGLCHVCRQKVQSCDLITAPTDSKFQIDVKSNFEHSTKTNALLTDLLALREKGAGEKAVVFSQWTTFLDLLEVPLGEKGLPYARLDGSLSQRQRCSVLEQFSSRDPSSPMILLISLKAGGVGLNLTCANHCYIMDPWWNPAVEEQAIMRIHRIGQQKQVRFPGDNTIRVRGALA